MLTIDHTPSGGTVIYGTERQDEHVREILKAHGWRWGRSIQMWYLPYSRDRAPKLSKIDETAAMLRVAGLEVAVMVDAAPRDQLTAEADRAARMEHRADELEGRANRRANESDRRYEAARQVADLIPLGQPILVDHYSAPRHRRALERIDTNMRRAVELSAEAKHAARGADSARSHMERREDPQRVARRIETLAAELRDVERKLAGTSNNGVEYGRPATGAWCTQLNASADHLRSQLEHWRQVRAAQTAAGTVTEWTAADFRLGDLVQRRGRDWGRVVRVNGKTLSVAYRVPGHGGDWPGKLPYHEVTGHQRPGPVEEAPTPIVEAPAPPAAQVAASPDQLELPVEHAPGQLAMAWAEQTAGQLVMAL